MLILLALPLAPMMAASALADTGKPGTGAAEVREAPGTEAPARLIEAQRLATLGEATRDPVLVFAAARLMQGLAPRAGGPADWTEGGQTPAPGSADLKTSATVPDPASAPPLAGTLDAAALFESARSMAPADSALREAITSAATEVPPPPVALALQAFSTKDKATLTLPLPGGAPVQIGFLTLAGQFAYTLTAPDGQVLCQDASATPGRLCTLTLPESQTLTLTTMGTADWLLLTP